MTTAQWFLLVGGLLLARGLTSSLLTRLPVTPAIIYLAVGLLVGPTALNVFHFNPLKQSALLEVLTEVAVLVSLFSAGIKMPVPVSLARWRTPILLATASMAISVGLVAASHIIYSICHWAPASCWARYWHPPIRCWRLMYRSAILEIATSSASY